MKVSVSLSVEDLETIDAFARAEGMPSRSAVIHRAIALLRHRSLEDDYAGAWTEWADSGEAAVWEGTVADGLANRSDEEHGILAPR